MAFELFFYQNRASNEKLRISFAKRGTVAFSSALVRQYMKKVNEEKHFVMIFVDEEKKRIGFKFVNIKATSTYQIKFYKAMTMISCKKLVDVVVGNFESKLGSYKVERIEDVKDSTEEEKSQVDVVVQF